MKIESQICEKGTKSAPLSEAQKDSMIFPRFDGHFSMMRNQGVRDEWKDKTGVRAGVQAADY